jgi:hypothetical protein
VLPAGFQQSANKRMDFCPQLIAAHTLVGAQHHHTLNDAPRDGRDGRAAYMAKKSGSETNGARA